MTFSHKNLFKPTPIKAKVFGKALASAVSAAAVYNTVNGGNAKISMACIALAFIAVFVAEFFGSDELAKADAAEAAITDATDAAEHAHDVAPAEYIEHVVTEQTLTDNPDLADHGVKAGDVVAVAAASDVPAEQPKAEATPAETPAQPAGPAPVTATVVA